MECVWVSTYTIHTFSYVLRIGYLIIRVMRIVYVLYMSAEVYYALRTHGSTHRDGNIKQAERI